MNKELILKYKAEFDHWLNEGEVLACPISSKLNGYAVDWQSIDENAHWNNKNIAYIINDAFVEFRKALAEGKTIQYNFGNFGTNKKDFPDIWKDLNLSIGILADSACPENYRIKPEEPKFKIGDWVILNGKHKRVTKAVDGYIDSLDNQVAVIMKEDSLELWEPKEEEYFWYKNDLVKFDEIKTNYGTLLNSIRGCSYHTAEDNFKDYCEPFIGQLPTSIKK